MNQFRNRFLPLIFLFNFSLLLTQTCQARNVTEERLNALENRIQQMQQQYELQIASLTAQIKELTAQNGAKPIGS